MQMQAYSDGITRGYTVLSIRNIRGERPVFQTELVSGLSNCPHKLVCYQSFKYVLQHFYTNSPDWLKLAGKAPLKCQVMT